jgi:hypothetical protein
MKTANRLKTGNRLQALPRALLQLLLVGLVSLGLFSVASADDGSTKATSAAPAARPQTSPAADHCTANEQPAAADVFVLSPSDAAVPADASCGAGYTLTRCACNIGCRPQNISPQNYCRFYLCGT